MTTPSELLRVAAGYADYIYIKRSEAGMLDLAEQAYLDAIALRRLAKSLEEPTEAMEYAANRAYDFHPENPGTEHTIADEDFLRAAIIAAIAAAGGEA